MAYFPKTIMPLTEKSNPIGSSSLASRQRITAEEYNLHDREIRAIETYLGADGTYPLAGVKPMDPQAASEEGTSVFDRVNALINNVNGFVDQTGGANVLSGYVLSGRRIPFPESAHATYLARIPGPRDTSITVNSTLGFPDSGIVSILNNVDVGEFADGRWSQTSSPRSIVEWIRYGAKTGTQFLQCQRGYMGTGVGGHHGAEVMHGSSATLTDRNIRDDPGEFGVHPVISDYTQTLADADGIFAADQPAYGRRYPGWRQRYGYAMNLLLMGGTLVDIAWRLMRRAGYLRINPAATDAGTFASVAAGLGLLGMRDSDGSYFLVSQDATAASQKVLTWDEADDLAFGLLEAGVVVEQFTPDTWQWPTGHVPIFRGRMHVNYAPANIGRSVKLRQSAMRITQFADGTIYGQATETKNKFEEMVSMIQFNCFFMSSLSPSWEQLVK